LRVFNRVLSGLLVVELVKYRHQYKTNHDPDGNVSKEIVIHDGFLP